MDVADITEVVDVTDVMDVTDVPSRSAVPRGAYVWRRVSANDCSPCNTFACASPHFPRQLERRRRFYLAVKEVTRW